MSTPEARFKTALRKHLSEQGIWWASCAAGPYSRKGDPDLIACVEGRIIAIEAKAPGGRLRPAQKMCRDELIASGGIYLVAYDINDVDDVISKIKEEQNGR